ncbi:MAG TPA: phospholipase D-like domain-containing protein [Burkholderiaceae bacterium]|nr:phospholipase D-like domain-containing protein [Burkholderiaceae bacterium]
MLVLGHLLFGLLCLLVYAVNTHVGAQRRHPSAAVAWVLLIALLPYAGLPLYLIFGSRKFVRPQPHHRAAPAPRDSSARSATVATLMGMGLAGPEPQHDVRFHRDGAQAWDELVALAAAARHQLDLCTYRLGNDPLGQQLAELLVQRAAAGVRVRLLLDSIGSLGTSRRLIARLRAAGVQVRWFMPLLHNPMRGRVNLRNHRKLTIADGRRLWSGGRNLAAEYFTGRSGEPAWVDASFTVDGPLAAQARELFESHWRHTDSAADDAPVLPAPAPQDGGRHLAQLVPSGPDQAEDTVHDLLLTEIFRARRQVLVVSPYFVPDDSLLTALCLAARRGVQVELILPERSNHRLADIARQRALRELAAAGARVRMTAGMTHAKAVVIDDTLALCGSLNLDARSLFLNFELMVAFYAPADIAALDGWIAATFGDARDFAARTVSLPRDIFEGLVRWLAFQI